jgi:hypothetical protein
MGITLGFNGLSLEKNWRFYLKKLIVILLECLFLGFMLMGYDLIIIPVKVGDHNWQQICLPKHEITI